MKLTNYFKEAIRKAGGMIFGHKPRLHRIPFGPLKGYKICSTFEMSPRAFLGIYDPWLYSISQKYIKKGDVVFDIGAQFGYTSLLFAKQLENTGAVHAFEILPSMTQTCLLPTVKANPFNNVVVHCLGFYSEERDFDLPVLMKGMTSLKHGLTPESSTPREHCHVTTIDKFVASNGGLTPRFCKMDVERAEIDCLKGAATLLRDAPPIWVIEFHGLDMLREGWKLLESYGYQLLNKNGVRIVSSLIDDMDHFHDSVLCLPPSYGIS